MAMKRVLVTGGSGFLGSHLLQLLMFSPSSRYGGALNELRSIVVLDTDPQIDQKRLRAWLSDPDSTADSKRAGPKLEVIKGNVCSDVDLNRAVRGCDTVFHLASVVHWSLNPNPKLQEVNVQGTERVIAACVRHNVRHPFPRKPNSFI